MGKHFLLSPPPHPLPRDPSGWATVRPSYDGISCMGDTLVADVAATPRSLLAPALLLLLLLLLPTLALLLGSVPTILWPVGSSVVVRTYYELDEKSVRLEREALRSIKTFDPAFSPRR